MFLSRLEIVLCDPFEKYLNSFYVNEKDVLSFSFFNCHFAVKNSYVFIPMFRYLFSQRVHYYRKIFFQWLHTNLNSVARDVGHSYVISNNRSLTTAVSLIFACCLSIMTVYYTKQAVSKCRSS